MSKPDWKDAPPEAEFLAQDERGTWFWYGVRPILKKDAGVWDIRSVHDLAIAAGYGLENKSWRKTLERRP